MIKPQEIAEQEQVMGTIVNLTSAFEGIASMRISQIKGQVQRSQLFFDELWRIYTQLRVDSLFRFGREEPEAQIDKELIIAVTAEGGFSGDIDQKLITWMLEYYKTDKHDIIIIGHHGALQLIQSGVHFVKYFKLPASDQKINVKPLVEYIRKYRETTVFYQTYVSLMVQDIKKIELQKAVQQAGEHVKDKEEIISDKNYIFEPSPFSVVAHLERSMVEISLSQVILDSKLAQYASRFRAMSVAKDRADDSFNELHLLYRRTKRSVEDERLKEIINGMKKAVIR